MSITELSRLLEPLKCFIPKAVKLMTRLIWYHCSTGKVNFSYLKSKDFDHYGNYYSPP